MFSKKEPKRFAEKQIQHYQYGLIHILIDRETGVHYLHVWNPQGSSLTPLLDEEGNVMIDKVAADA